MDDPKPDRVQQIAERNLEKVQDSELYNVDYDPLDPDDVNDKEE